MGATIGICMVTALIANAKQAGIAVDDVTGVVSTKARVPGGGRAPHLADFEIDVYVDGELSEAERAELERSTATACEVRETLRLGARVSERVHLGSATAVPSRARQL